MTLQEPHVEISLTKIYDLVLKVDRRLDGIEKELALGQYPKRITDLERAAWREKGFAAAIGAAFSLAFGKLHLH